MSKHFNEHIKKLKRFAKRRGIKISYVESINTSVLDRSENVMARAAFSPQKNAVLLVEGLDVDESLVYIIAHELGHAIDFNENPDQVILYDFCVKSLNTFEDIEDVPFDIREILFIFEEQAFTEGEKIMRKLKIPFQNSYYSSFKNDALDCYSELFGVDYE